MAEEEKCYHPILDDPRLDGSSLLGTVRSSRYAPPAHYIFKIESFSSLVNALAQIDKDHYESDSFESGGYYWKLRLYPNGDVKRNGDSGHMSLYLVLANAPLLPQGSVLSVCYKLFLYDHIRNTYLTVEQDGCGERNKFHKSKGECGFSQFIPLPVFNHTPSGYLADDSCIFGAEVFVIDNKPKIDFLSNLAPPNNIVVRMELSKLLKYGIYQSPRFVAGGKHWSIYLNPSMFPKEKCKHINLCLLLINPANFIVRWLEKNNLKGSEEVYVDCQLRVKNQITGQHVERRICSVLSHHDDLCPGFKFMELSVLKDQSQGFVVNDIVIVEVQFSTILCNNKF